MTLIKCPSNQCRDGRRIRHQTRAQLNLSILLETEADVYRTLSGGAGLPRVYAYQEGYDHNAMVFDILGPSLEDLFNFCGCKFSLKTLLMLADQLIYRLEYIQSKGIIHRDVKPGNFLMGLGRQENQVYVTDLGLATEDRNANIAANKTPVRHPNLIGTAIFARVNGHLGTGKFIDVGFCSSKTYSQTSTASLR